MQTNKLAEWNNILKKYPDKKSALIPILHLAQREKGYITGDMMQEIADFLEIRPEEVYETATFYSMFNVRPVGKYHIQVCRNLSCSLLGAIPIIEFIGKKLQIGVGDTTPDNMFSLNTVECLASCGTAPMMQINEDYYENLTEEKVDKILEDLRSSVKV